MHIQFRHLWTIIASHENGRVAKAADSINITQSALSHQIKGLEEQAGVELFVRRAKLMKLSAAGLRLLRAVETVLPEIDALQSEFDGLCDGRSGWLLPVLGKFRKHWPNVDVDIRPGLSFDALPALQKEEVDLVISSDPEDIPEIEFKHLFDYESVFVASKTHPLAQKDYTTADDFRDQTLVTYPV